MTSIQTLLIRTMGTRVAVLPIQAIATFLATYLTIRTVGAETYAAVGLLVGLQALFGFLNLGSSASVATAAGESLVQGQAHLFRVLVTATRVTCAAGAGLVIASLAIAILGLWPTILGQGDPQLLTAGAIVAIVSVALIQPLTQGVSVLMSTGHTVAATVSTAGASVVAVVLVACSAALHLPAIAFVACPYAAQIVVSAGTSVIAARLLKLSLRSLVTAVRDWHVSGARIGPEARPAFLIWLLLPLAYQTDRLIISHLSSTEQLASYNVAAQFFTAGFSIVLVGSGALWGFFARARAASELPTFSAFVKLCMAFGLLGLCIASIYIVTMPWVASLVSGDAITVSRWLSICFGALIVSQAVHQPSAMLQTDESGLRFTAGAFIVMTALNVSLGLLLTSSLGAVGPVLASVVAMTVALAIPSLLRARRVLTDL